ncbi:MAG TPA: zinc-dependent metalloprotease [Frankiaceae bacterium]|jgi:coenzyme F420 biosynthesis associated uncharacterized protein|nr:zinc-dependent metalloprotease [Frankiaceae bacterium]
MPGELVDWDLATSTGRRLSRPGPALAAEAADAVVAQLRILAAEAEGHVVDYTKLVPVGPEAPVAVVDRSDWIGANVAGLRVMSRPLLSKLEDRQTGRIAGAAGRRVSGVQVGGLLAYLSSKVLGQYEVFGDGYPESASGRLLLVAPNIADVERRLDVSPRDFRMWVCLHEQTHRLQFTAVPWLRDHLAGELATFADVTDLDPTALAARLRAAAGTVRRREGASILELLQTPEQRVVLDRLQALMTLLEGHADQVMDAVGPSVVPSVKKIRDRFERRRDGGSPIDRVVRRLLGLDMKMQQYRQGGAFVRAVVDRVGVGGFNTVWESPQTLPTRAELAAPEAWLTRVLGLTPAA